MEGGKVHGEEGQGGNKMCTGVQLSIKRRKKIKIARGNNKIGSKLRSASRLSQERHSSECLKIEES